MANEVTHERFGDVSIHGNRCVASATPQAADLSYDSSGQVCLHSGGRSRPCFVVLHGKIRVSVLTTSPSMQPRRWIELQIPGAQTNLTLFRMTDGLQPGSRMNFTFASDDVAATYAQLTARGVQFVQPPTAAPWGTFAMFKDSEGNSIVLSTRR